MVVTINNKGKEEKITLQKTIEVDASLSRDSISKNYIKKNLLKTINIPLNGQKNITINEMLDKARTKIGNDEFFFGFSLVYNNCQVYCVRQ